jgi:hypothetical protein
MSAGRAPCRLTYIAADDAEGQARLAAFTQALSQLGWSEGRNLRIDTCWATISGFDFRQEGYRGSETKT